MSETKPDYSTATIDPEEKTKPGQMTTLTSVLEKLRVKKHDREFKLTPEGFGAGTGKYYKPEDLKIIRTYRFEGESDPGDNSVIYVIEANDGLIGYSMDAYGVYSSHEEEEGYDDFIRRIPVEERDEQIIFGDDNQITGKDQAS